MIFLNGLYVGQDDSSRTPTNKPDKSTLKLLEIGNAV